MVEGFVLANRHVGVAMRLLEPLQVLHSIVECLVLASRLWCLLLLLLLLLPSVLLMLLLLLQSLMSRLILLLLLLPSLLLLLLFSLFNELRLLKPMLASCNQVSHSLTGMLAVCINELWLLKQMLAYINQCSCLLTVFFNELQLLKQMLASCNHISHLLTGMLAVCFNELRLLPWMFAYCRQFSQSLTGTSILLLSSFFKKLKRHRTIYFHNDVIAFGTFMRITEIGSNLGINLIPQFCIPFVTFISVQLIEEKLRMTARLKRIIQSREELVPMGLDVFLKCCLPLLISGLLANKGEFLQQC